MDTGIDVGRQDFDEDSAILVMPASEALVTVQYGHVECYVTGPPNQSASVT